MRKNLLLLSLLLPIFFIQTHAQLIYSNNSENGTFLPPIIVRGVPITIVDDILIPQSTIGAHDSLAITKVTFGIVRQQGAQAVTVYFYLGNANDTVADLGHACEIPLTEIGSKSLPLYLQTGKTFYYTFGDGINPLYTMKVNNNILKPDYHTLFAGVKVDKLSAIGNSGWGYTYADQSVAFDSGWATDGTIIDFITVSDGTSAITQTYNLQVEGYTYGTLPVSLLSFAATIKNNAANLSWRTATEANNKGFDIERSSDGRSFTKIGFVPGAGNSNTIQQYAFADINLKDIKTATAYYRLKQTDLDGKGTYSQVLPLKLSGITNWSVYPNPITSNTAIQLQLTESGRVNIQVLNAQGKVVKVIDKGLLPEGTQTLPLNLQNLARGVYFVKLIVNDAVVGTQAVTK